MQLQPDDNGHFGIYGGRYIAETLMPVILEVDKAYGEACADASFNAEFLGYLKNYVGRPSPMYFAERLTDAWGGAKVYLKREDLNHTGAHKINNTIGQALLARRMGRKKLMAETGAGQHGVATATVAALFGMECDVYMGEEDIVRQEPNVKRMELLGAKVVPVSSGTKTLKDAMSEALRAWVAEAEETFYIIGSVAGPHPYPLMVRDFQSVIGREAREQILATEGSLPEMIIACVGGGSNAAGIFYPFIEDKDVAPVGVEAAGYGLDTDKHAAPLSAGSPGVLHGSYSYMMQDEHGQVQPTHSVSAGLDYPGVGAEHSWLKETGRAEYVAATDEQALEAFRWLAEREGLIPAFESSHAFAVLKMEGLLKPGDRVLVNLSGRGDKDMDELIRQRNQALGNEAGPPTRLFC